jgi:hypothetical protein
VPMWRLVKLEMWNGLGLNAACAALQDERE